MQSKALDPMFAVSMIEQNKIKISTLWSDESFEHLSQEVDAFILEQGDENEEFIHCPLFVYVRRKNVWWTFRWWTYFRSYSNHKSEHIYFCTRHSTITTIWTFQWSIGVLKDLTLLTSKVIFKINLDSNFLPKDSFKFFLEIYEKFVDKRYLCSEY